MAYHKGEVDSCFIRSKWFLAATCDVPETVEFKVADWLGFDLGITSLAVDSVGTIKNPSCEPELSCASSAKINRAPVPKCPIPQ